MRAGALLRPAPVQQVRDALRLGLLPTGCPNAFKSSRKSDIRGRTGAQIRIPALKRPAFWQIAAAAHPGDTLTVSELFRLCRDLSDIQAVRDWCQARGAVLRVLSGADQVRGKTAMGRSAGCLPSSC